VCVLILGDGDLVGTARVARRSTKVLIHSEHEAGRLETPPIYWPDSTTVFGVALLWVHLLQYFSVAVRRAVFDVRGI